MYARIVFSVSTVLFGVITLMWHDADTWQTPFRLLSLPAGSVIGDGLAIALIVGGIGMLAPRTARIAAMILIVVYALFFIAGIPGVIAAPTTFGYYDGLFEQICMLSGALGAYAATEMIAARSSALGRAARIGLGLSTISFTLAQIFYLKFTASLVPTWIPPNQMFWAMLTTIAFGLAAIAILTKVQARLALRLLTLMLAIFGVAIWVPTVIAHPEAHGNWSEFALNFQITGAAWLVAELKSF